MADLASTIRYSEYYIYLATFNLNKARARVWSLCAIIASMKMGRNRSSLVKKVWLLMRLLLSSGDESPCTKHVKIFSVLQNSRALDFEALIKT